MFLLLLRLVLFVPGEPLGVQLADPADEYIRRPLIQPEMLRVADHCGPGYGSETVEVHRPARGQLAEGLEEDPLRRGHHGLSFPGPLWDLAPLAERSVY